MMLVLSMASPVLAWDSRLEIGVSFGLPSHTAFTSCAINLEKRTFPFELYNDIAAAIKEGCLCELHEVKTVELDIKAGNTYGLDLVKKRTDHKGTNEGCDDMVGWWQDAITAYRAGNKKQAYFIVGIMLHMIQDMGVPAHANKVEHQGSPTEFDNFEFNAAINPTYLNLRSNDQDTKPLNRSNPNYTDPWLYYNFSQDWTLADAPNYKNRDKFPKTRFFWEYGENEKNLMYNRQLRTFWVSYWFLDSAIKAFKRG